MEQRLQCNSGSSLLTRHTQQEGLSDEADRRVEEAEAEDEAEAATA